MKKVLVSIISVAFLLVSMFTLVACGVSTDYTITFETNGGGTITSQTVYGGEEATRPTAPAKDDYVFVGWYSDSAFATEFDFGSEITADTTLYAKYLAGTTNLYFEELNGGTYSIGGFVDGSDVTDDDDETTTVVIPDMHNGKDVSAVGEDAFWVNETITSVMLGNNIVALGDSAFHYCEVLTDFIVNEDNAKYSAIDGNLYNKNATTLVKYTIGKESTTFVMPEGVTTIGDSAFALSNIESVTNMSAVTTLEDGAFWICKSLATIDLSSVVTIGAHAFYECWDLVSIDLSSVEKIGELAFNTCSDLESVVLGDLETIGDSAFYFCEGLKSIDLSNIKSISNDAFAFCRSLTTVDLCNVESIGDRAFYACESITEFKIADDNNNFKIIDGNLYNSEGTTLLQYALGKTETTFTMPDGVTTIGEASFMYSTIDTIYMTDVVTIGYQALGYCENLTTVDLGSVATIEEDAFIHCTSLSAISIPSSVTTMGKYVFYGCPVTVSVSFAEGEEPDGWDDNWYGTVYNENLTINYNNIRG